MNYNSSINGPLSSNIVCFLAMIMWAVGFPLGEILLKTWGAVSLNSIRLILAVFFLMIYWIASEGVATVISAPWRDGLLIGGFGFGLGALLLLVGQKFSDAITPAVVASMMPIAGAMLEVLFDKRKLRFYLLVGITMTIVGGVMATGGRLSNNVFNIGPLLCFIAIFLFAWATRMTTNNFKNISPLGQTCITLSGSMITTNFVYITFLVFNIGETEIGSIDSKHIIILLLFSLPAIAISQLLWIWAAGRLGILMASLHMNAVPFYVMLIIVVFSEDLWNWDRAIGGLIVATGILVAQTPELKKLIILRKK